MPDITITVFKDRSLEQRRRLVEAITAVTQETLGVSAAGVRITFLRIDREDVAIGGELLSDRKSAAGTPVE